MNWKGVRVFVTGGSGFIGSHLLERLVSLEAIVSAFEHEQKPSAKNTFRGSLRDNPFKLKEYLLDFKPDFVFHLAAQPIVTTAMKDDLKTMSVNISGTYNILHACKDIGLKGFIHVSTDKVYGKYSREVCEEDVLLGADHPYNSSKLCGDIIAQTYSQSYQVPVIICRSGNIYGEGDKNVNRIIPETIISTLLGKQTKIRSDGTLTRDYIYVGDIVDAYLLLAETVCENSDWYGRAVNFGAEKAVSVIDLVHEILGEMRRIDLYPVIENTAKLEIPYQHLDWNVAKSIGWKPKTTLETGIGRSIAWYKEHLSEFS